jgi:hypothetical protein
MASACGGGARRGKFCPPDGREKPAHASAQVARPPHPPARRPLIRLRAFTERPDPPSPTAGRREGGHCWLRCLYRKPARCAALIHHLPRGEKEEVPSAGRRACLPSPLREKVSAQLTDEGAPGLRMRELLRPSHMLRFSPEIRASTAFAASSTLEPAPGSGPSFVIGNCKGPLIRLRAFTERSDPPSPTAGRREGARCRLRCLYRKPARCAALIGLWVWQGRSCVAGRSKALIRLRTFAERLVPPSPTGGRGRGVSAADG